MEPSVVTYLLSIFRFFLIFGHFVYWEGHHGRQSWVDYWWNLPWGTGPRWWVSREGENFKYLVKSKEDFSFQIK